jgi:hypothetical protein
MVRILWLAEFRMVSTMPTISSKLSIRRVEHSHWDTEFLRKIDFSSTDHAL